MNRREMLAVTGAVVGTVVSSRVALAAERTAPHRDSLHSDCLQACNNCRTVCNETAGHCLGLVKTGKGEHAAAAQLALDCEEFCGLSSKLIARDSTLMFTACDACAKACDACATECEKLAADEVMAACAKACRTCAKTCRAMSHHHQ